MSASGKEDPPHRSTVAILGNSPVICRAIAHLVERGGYETRVVDTVGYEPGDLAGVDVALITADSDPGDWETQNWSSTFPVLRLAHYKQSFFQLFFVNGDRMMTFLRFQI